MAPSSRTVAITGNAKMYGTGGDGVILTIKKTSTTLWGPSSIAESDTTTGVSHDLQTTVSTGDAIYFIVNKNGNNFFDSTIWNPKVSIFN